MNSNISLIGMPGAGKSVIGKLLAAQLSWQLIDTDRLIEDSVGTSLQQLLDEKGYLAVREIEEAAILSLEPHHTVISTGGSAVYSERGMAHLKSTSTLVFLDIDLATVKQRIHNFGERGIASAQDHSLEMIFAERYPLYQQYADITLPNSAADPAQAVATLVERLNL